MTPVKDHYRFGVLFDGSPCAVKILTKTMSIMASVDRLTTITVLEEGMDMAAIEQKIVETCGDHPHDTVKLMRRQNETVKERVKAYLVNQAETDKYIDFVCLGGRGINYGNAVDGHNSMGRVA